MENTVKLPIHLGAGREILIFINHIAYIRPDYEFDDVTVIGISNHEVCVKGTYEEIIKYLKDF